MSLAVSVSGAGPDIALIHGWGTNGAVFDALAARLAASHRVHVVDLPGYGTSAPMPAHSLPSLARAVAAVLPPRCRLLGWSLGGQVALTLALNRPEAVERLVLVSTTPLFVAGPGWKHGMAAPDFQKFADDLRGDWAGILKRFFALQFRGEPDERKLAATVARAVAARGAPAPGVLDEGLALLSGADLRGVLGAVAVPTLVIHGGHDLITRAGAGRWLAAHIPAASHLELAGCGHAPFLSHPDEFAASLEVFLGH